MRRSNSFRGRAEHFDHHGARCLFRRWQADFQADTKGLGLCDADFGFLVVERVSRQVRRGGERWAKREMNDAKAIVGDNFSFCEGVDRFSIAFECARELLDKAAWDFGMFDFDSWSYCRPQGGQPTGIDQAGPIVEQPWS